jgi:6-phosphogluconolactonase
MPNYHGAVVMIRVLADAEMLCRAAADLFIEQAWESIDRRQRFAVALSGGRTPRGLYELLAQPPLRDAVAWEKVHVFWGDERCVPSDDPRSNARMARETLIDRVPLPPDQVHPIACAEDADRSARQYSDLLHHFFSGGPPVFDLVLLGLGEDGHTASLFPYTNILGNNTAWTGSIHSDEQDMDRVTLMPTVFNQARKVVFLVAGNAKTSILKEVLESPQDPKRWPAQLIHPAHGELIWLADRAAALHLKSR